MSRFAPLSVAAPVGLLFCGCTGAAASPRPEVATIGPDPEPVVATQPITIVGFTTTELIEKFERARSFLLAEEYAQAAKAFDHLMRLASSREIASVSAFNAGLAHDHLGQHDVALERFRGVWETYPEQDIALSALVHLTRVLGYLERWREMGEAADLLLDRPGLTVVQQIEGFGARALARIERGDQDGARRAIGKAQRLIDQNGIGRAGSPPVQLAQVAFARGELLRLESEAIALTPVPPNFGAVLEARCQGLLDAQAAYVEAMRSRDAHWSAMSGYRVGQLYQRLHIEAMAIPAPDDASEDQQALFVAAMRLRYRILLEKGLKMMAATVRLGDRTGETSVWITRAREAEKSLERALEDEKAALARTPYTEAEIRAALDKLKGT
ncbi:MAG: hypothetical protein AAF928_18790 [Myxococcota bacterium]